MPRAQDQSCEKERWERNPWAVPLNLESRSRLYKWHQAPWPPKYLPLDANDPCYNSWLLLPLFSRSLVSNSLWPHGLQHARPPCPSPTPRVYSNSCPLSQWCHPTISSSAVPFSSCPQSFPASGSFPVSQLFASGGQSTGVLDSASVLSMRSQCWSPLGLTGLISLQSRGLSRVFFSTTVWKHRFFITQPSFLRRVLLETSKPRDRGAWCAAIYGVARSQTWLKRLSSSRTWASFTSKFSLPQAQHWFWLVTTRGHFSISSGLAPGHPPIKILLLSVGADFFLFWTEGQRAILQTSDCMWRYTYSSERRHIHVRQEPAFSYLCMGNTFLPIALKNSFKNYHLWEWFLYTAGGYEDIMPRRLDFSFHAQQNRNLGTLSSFLRDDLWT